MRRFEYKDAKSHKFWEIEVEGDAFTVRYGKFGADGQVQTKFFASEDKAQAEAQKVIKSKIKKGYAEIRLDPKAKAKAKTKTKAKAKAKAKTTKAELDAAIVQSPNDLAAWQVYFDWLQNEGDPWGERGNLVLARDKATGAAKTKLTKRIKEFDKIHSEALYGKRLLELMKEPDFTSVAQLSDRYGFIWTVKVAPGDLYTETYAPDAIKALIKSPAARFLTEIHIGSLDDEYTVQKGVDVIRKAGKLEALRSLYIGDYDPRDGGYLHVDVDARKVLGVAPNLRSLRIRGDIRGLDRLEHETLESLVIESYELPRAVIANVDKCKLPALTRLEVRGRCEDGNIKQVGNLLKGKGVPALVHLGLKWCDWEDRTAEALAKSDLLPQLKTLNLAGSLYDSGSGVEAIISNADKFKHLERLVVGGNHGHTLSDRQVSQLRAALGKIVDLKRSGPEAW